MERQLSRHVDDNILAKGVLDSRDLYEGQPIQEGMEALPDESTRETDAAPAEDERL